MTLEHSSALPVGSPLIPDNSMRLQCSHTSSLGMSIAARCSHLLHFIHRAISRARPGPWELLWAWAPRLCAPSLPPHAGLWESLSRPAAHDLWFSSINSFIPSFLEASWSDFQLLFPFWKDILEYITTLIYHVQGFHFKNRPRHQNLSEVSLTQTLESVRNSLSDLMHNISSSLSHGMYSSLS